MDQIEICETDPAAAEAVACRAAYYAELDRRFAGGFVAGPDTPATLDEMRPPAGTFLIARRGAVALGCVALRPDGAGVAEVKRLWVSAAARGQGLATRLMAAAESRARALGYAHLRLDTNGSLHEALAFYARAGWTAIGRYNDNPYAEAWFEKPL